MPVDLRCDCGYELQLAEEEAQETTWCPRCRKLLVQPKDVTARRAFTRGSGPAPASGGSSAAAGARLAAVLVFGVILAVGRGACTDSSRYDSPAIDLRDLEVPPVQRFEVPPLPDVPAPDNRPFPGFGPQPEERNRFFPPDRDPRLPVDLDDLPGGRPPGPGGDDP
jgi:hypothetical protein